MGSYTGPGAWADPDELIIGDFSLSPTGRQWRPAVRVPFLLSARTPLVTAPHALDTPRALGLAEAMTQMSFWCLWAAPLLMSVDLRTISDVYAAILQNKQARTLRWMLFLSTLAILLVLFY